MPCIFAFWFLLSTGKRRPLRTALRPHKVVLITIKRTAIYVRKVVVRLLRTVLHMGTLELEEEEEVRRSS